MIKVGVVGALGKMGREVVKTVLNSDDMKLVMAADMAHENEDIGQIICGTPCNVKVQCLVFDTIRETKPDVVVDFTQPETILERTCMYLSMHTKSVIGTTGFSEEDIEYIKQHSLGFATGCMIAPNFSTGAVLMMMFAKQAAKYFKNAEIIELHHNKKKDAPSGTAIKTAKLMAEVNPDFTSGNCHETELLSGARGCSTNSNIHIHSVRMPGYIASQEVIFGSDGQIFKIKHDTMDRACYMDGVKLAIRHVYENNDFVYGLENIL